MRFMMLVKSAENKGAPPKELMDAMAKLSEEAVKAGTIRDSGGAFPAGGGNPRPPSPGEGTPGDRALPPGQGSRGRGVGPLLETEGKRDGRGGAAPCRCKKTT